MSTQPRLSCPCCASEDLLQIGKLPDGLWFAGNRLEQPLPGGWLSRCRTCNLKFRNSTESEAVYQQLYDNATTTTWLTGVTRADWERIVQYIAEREPHGAKILDFGCYTGGLLTRLGKQYHRYGVEINRAAADVASQCIGRSVWSSLNEISEEIRFDVIIASDVIEHVTNPMTIIEQLIAKLSKNGVLIITTGDADNYLWNRFGANWWYCFFPEHVAFLSKSWLKYVSGDVGLDIVCCETFCYSKLSLARRLTDVVQTYFYGWFPSIYLVLVKLLGRMLGRPGISSVPGCGISRDHLFIVLSRADRS